MTTGNPELTGHCLKCGGALYLNLAHSCSTGVRGPGRVCLLTPPRVVWLHIHKDGHSASTTCPEEECLFGRRVKYVLAE